MIINQINQKKGSAGLSGWKKRMKKTLIFAALASMLALSACSSKSTSSVSYSVSYTDESGNTVEKNDGISVDTNVGVDPSNGVTSNIEVSSGAPETTAEETEEAVETEEETEISEEGLDEEEPARPDPEAQRQYLAGKYAFGCEAEDSDGITYYMLFDNQDLENVLLVYLFPDKETATYAEGEVSYENNQYTIHDMSEDMAVTFEIPESREDGMDLVFLNTDETIVFQLGDKDEMIEDVVDILQNCNIVALADVSAS